MIHEIINPESTRYAIACNPLVDHYTKALEVGTINNLSTGQPFLITGDSMDEVYDLVYSSYVVIDILDYNSDNTNLERIRGVEESSVLHEVVWSIGYDKAEADATISVIQSLLPYLKINAIKHPSREEYALPYSEHMVSTAPDGALKDAISAKHSESISDSFNFNNY